LPHSMAYDERSGDIYVADRYDTLPPSPALFDTITDTLSHHNRDFLTP
jgi:hypothetical protein